MSYFEEQLNADEAATELRELLASIRGWMDANGFHNPQSRKRFKEVQLQLENKQRNILFLAEFSRGKTELINTTFFGSAGERLLTSSPGRTTRCTTELQYNPEELPSIKLLPTMSSSETQRQPLSMLRRKPSVWEQTLFAASDTEGVKRALNKVCESDLVTIEMAHQLGFIEDLEQEELSKLDLLEGKVAVPRWRHAIINYPHPLLKEGLSIIDTPGLNALGIEPDLTIRALDSANAIVFVVSADTGITRSELDIWQHYIQRGTADNVLVVVNKIDMLWDELKSRSDVEQDIKKQVREVSRVLGIPKNQVFAVSAQKALLARKRNDHRLLAASGIRSYEQALADTINYTTRKGVIDRASQEVVPTMDAIHRVLTQRIEATRHHISELKQHKQTQSGITENNISKIKKETRKLQRVSEKLNLFRADLKLEYEQFVNKLDIYFLNKMIAQYRFEISNQLTTPGLQREMNDFRAVAVDRFKNALSHIVNLEKKLVHVYESVERILGVDGLQPRKLHPENYLNSLRQHTENHDRFAKGFSMIITEQHALRDRYHASVMVKLRRLYIQTRDEIDLWCRNSLIPLELEVKERESQLRKRLTSLERLHQKDATLGDEITVLEHRLDKHVHRIKSLNRFKQRLRECTVHNVRDNDNVVELHAHKSAS